uniref:CAZy families CBM48/GH13 protein n=1 Tax=uncultured Geobacillus sp. TaxID=228952 RepID=A0A060BSW9_9BACL|nr:CAZy families CBM48/GH13 protein [uncultured Geobacillus sp.]
MPTALPSEDKSSLNNAFALPFVGFFNDRFRDFTKGPSQRERLGEKGYLTGDLGKIDDFKYAYAACSIRINHNPLFQNPLQSIDYVECHDNNTLYDKLKASLGGESETSILERLKMINAIVVFGAEYPSSMPGRRSAPPRT